MDRRPSSVVTSRMIRTDYEDLGDCTCYVCPKASCVIAASFRNYHDPKEEAEQQNFGDQSYRNTFLQKIFLGVGGLDNQLSLKYIVCFLEA